MSESKRFDRNLLISGAAIAAALAGAHFGPATPAAAQQIQAAPPRGAPISFADLIDRVRPAVVSISVRQRPTAAQGQTFQGAPPGYEEFFRGPRGNRPPAVSLGSGFFISADGVIVTNHHVVDGAEDITVRVSDGRELQAEIVGTDEPTDLAVLRIRGGGNFRFVSFDRAASDVRVGDWVVAVGNPFGLDGTATAGIISAMGRRDAGSSAYVDFLQIDAPINRGNSGGPTFDLQGRVIGVNSAIFSPTGGNVGIGFAIPASVAAGVVDQLLRAGRVSRGWLGVEIQPLDADIARSLGLPEARGALVARVMPDSPAARAGLQQGDVVLSFNGQSVADSRELTQRVGASAIGASSNLEVLRGGQRRNLTVRLAERPGEQALASTQPGQRPTPAPQPAPQSAPQAPLPALGLSVRPATADDRARAGDVPVSEGALVIADLDPAGTLAERGVRPGDLIISAGGAPMRTQRDLDDAVARARASSRPLLLQVANARGRRFVAIDVAARQ